MDVDASMLTDDDLGLLKRAHARYFYDDTARPRLRRWSWSLSLALTEELERRQEILRALSDDLGDGESGEQVCP